MADAKNALAMTLAGGRPYNALTQFNEPMQPNALGRGTLKPGPEPTGYDRLFDGIYGMLGGTPDRRALAEALAGGVNVGTLGMATGAYDGAKELAQTGQPSSLAMALMPGAKVAGAGAKAAGKAAGEAVQGIRAYHGSPHDFDRFDLSKIGTGEGAQAYGHGLYFAEAEDVARDYRNKLGGAQLDGSTGNVNIDSMLRRMFGGDWEKAKASGYIPAHEIARIEKEGLVPKATPQGRMYEVNIKANPADFLDWDKPLSQQSEKVRQALQGKKPDKRAFNGIVDQDSNGDWIAYSSNGGQYAAKTEAEAYAMLKDPPVGQAYNFRDPKETEALRAQGVAGVRYLDQGSRGAGEGSRNYVAFDDSLIEILRKYGLLPPAVAGGVAASQSPAEAGQ